MYLMRNANPLKRLVPFTLLPGKHADKATGNTQNFYTILFLLMAFLLMAFLSSIPNIIYFYFGVFKIRFQLEPLQLVIYKMKRLDHVKFRVLVYTHSFIHLPNIC